MLTMHQQSPDFSSMQTEQLGMNQISQTTHLQESLWSDSELDKYGRDNCHQGHTDASLLDSAWVIPDK